MESNTVTLNNTNTNTNTTVEKKMRKPSLPAKFAKFIQFGYFFIKQYNAMDGVTPIDETSFLDKLHLFDTVDNQQLFVQAFFDDAKNVNKTIRKVVQAKIKADAKAAAPPKVKAPRVKKPKANANANADADSTVEPTVDGSEEPTKTSRRKKKIAVVPDVQDELINELTSLANNTSTTTDSNADTKTAEMPKADKPKADKPKADKPKAEKKPKVEKPKVEKPKVEKKPKVVKNTNNVDNVNDNNVNDNDNDNDNDIITSPIIIDGKQFLVDDSNNVYDFDNHLIVGKLHHNSFTPL